jgi:hypothetical protein
MPWKYKQSTGRLYRPNGQLFSQGYSGKGEHENRPESQNIANQGPIPRGTWHMVDIFDSNVTTSRAIKLSPSINTNTFGRSNFQIHGGALSGAHTASTGCIIVDNPAKRQEIYNSDDHVLEVVE